MKSYSPIDQLNLLEEQCKQIMPDLYKNYALYLQYIRQYLKKSVRDLVANIYLQNKSLFQHSESSNDNLTFQKDIDELVNRTISLLTIEHLVDLNRQIEEEVKLKRDLAKNKLLRTLESQRNNPIKLNDSIELSLAPPIESIDNMTPWFDESELDNQSSDIIAQNNNLIDKDILLSDSNLKKTDPELFDENEKGDLDNNSKKVYENDMFRSIFLMAGDIFNLNKKNVNIKDRKPTKDFNADHRSNTLDEDSFSPKTPQEMLKWMNSLEIALSRRLINLSHSINIELLRNGIINTLIPLNLLEAVSRGHLETLDSAPNMLKIRVPFPNSLIEDNIDISCLLLRPSEFEFEQPLLRRCRALIRRNRSIFLKLSKKQQYWQERLLAIEVQEKWWKNP